MAGYLDLMLVCVGASLLAPTVIGLVGWWRGRKRERWTYNKLNHSWTRRS